MDQQPHTFGLRRGGPRLSPPDSSMETKHLAAALAVLLVLRGATMTPAPLSVTAGAWQAPAQWLR